MGILRVINPMTTPSDFPDLGGGGTPPRPPRPPRRPPPAGGGGGGGPQMPQMPQMPDVNKKAVFVGAIVVLFLVFIAGAFVSGKGGIIEVKDTEVAVIVNYLTGESEIVNRPGYKLFIPFLAQAFIFDSSPNSFIMEGERDIDSNHVKKLTVRANDGSSFWFESLEIQYQIIPSSAHIVLHDSGPGNNFKENWVKAFARSVLRDEFGRASTEEIANAQNLSQPKADAKDRLNKMLEPHGIFIMQIITPKPKFETRYERAIEARKEAGQLVETLKERENKLVEERIKRLANVERDKATEYELLLGTMENDRISEEKVAVRVTKTADAYRIEKVGAGKAAEGRLIQQARGLEIQARKEAEGLTAKVEALAARGDILVREELARKFARIIFEIIPYRRDPSPTRIEHLGAVPGARNAGGNN